MITELHRWRIKSLSKTFVSHATLALPSVSNNHTNPEAVIRGQLALARAREAKGDAHAEKSCDFDSGATDRGEPGSS